MGILYTKVLTMKHPQTGNSTDFLPEHLVRKEKGNVGRRVLIILPILLLGVALVVFFAMSRSGPSTGDARQIAQVVRIATPAEIVAGGTVKPQVGAEVKVGSQISGRIAHLNAKVGDAVVKGQVLAVLDTTEFEASLRRAEADLEVEQARLRAAEQVLARRERLYAEGLISREELEEAQVGRDQAAAMVNSARARGDSSSITLAHATIRAPISGTVASISTQEGEVVAASFAAPTFFTIIDLSRLQVETYVDEVDIGAVDIGQPAAFTSDAFRGKVFHGRVVAVNPQAMLRDNVVNYAVIVSLQDDELGSLLRPEMTVSVTIFSSAKRDILIVPSKAVIRDNGATFVLAKKANGISRKEVSLGRDYGDRIEVTSGLSQGDVVYLQTEDPERADND